MCNKIVFLIKLKSFIPSNILLIMYYAFVHPDFNYSIGIKKINVILNQNYIAIMKTLLFFLKKKKHKMRISFVFIQKNVFYFLVICIYVNKKY